MVTQDCGPNEVYNSCGTACPDTCETVVKGNKGLMTCTMQCVSGCFCRDGLVRDGSQCVSAETCRQKSPLLRDSGSNAGFPLTAIHSQLALFIPLIVLIFKNYF
ncbi:unnamed protein product [Oppiella nova]|uniref:TIL domain-containing protein n=1 Tax=Oppiella nova TaxID=334625 RepID=A0A7R9QR80_9ACAR|nr:unnamed protein product [Oppiella nova]CAG2172717.1 unnamed protein product [Oppiella nova]